MMSEKYYIYAGGRWCELETRRGRVAGGGLRARVLVARGGGARLHAARGLVRALRALAAAPAGERAHQAHSRPRSKERGDSCPLTHLHHCCTHSHSRCDVNADELGKPSPAGPPRAKRRRMSNKEANKTIPMSPLKQRHESLRKSWKQMIDSDLEIQTVFPRKLNESPSQNSQTSSQKSRKRIVDVCSLSNEEEVQTVQKSATQIKARRSSQQNINVIIAHQSDPISDDESIPQYE